MRPVPERIAARDAGEIHYRAAKPCKNGHEPIRYTATGVCCECALIWTKKYRNARPGIEAKWARERRATDPSSHRAEAKRWWEKNKERAAEANRRWKKANPERRRELGRVGSSNRRSREQNNGGCFTAEDFDFLYAAQKGRCAHCKKRSLRLELDHITPVILGGASDRSNLQLLCLPCNRRKGKQDPIDWAHKHGLLL